MMAVTGIVKHYNKDKGLGFIKRSDGGGEDVFLDHTTIRHLGKVTSGQRLVFDIRDNGRGPRAVNVSRPDDDGTVSTSEPMTPSEHAEYVKKRSKA